MATSTIHIQTDGLIPVQTFDTSEKSGTLFNCGKVCLLILQIDSGSNGMSQYYTVISQGIYSNYRPSYAVRGFMSANNGQTYGIQVLASGSVQLLNAIPANVHLNVLCSWSI